MRAFILAAFLYASLSTMPAAAQTTASYSTAETDIGTLLDDPAAKAVLDKHVPGFADDPQVQMARPMTLKGIQQYAADKFTDEVLAAIDADLKKLSQKK